VIAITLFTLAIGAFCVFLFDRRNRGNAAVALSPRNPPKNTLINSSISRRRPWRVGDYATRQYDG
jgi:hypothetical protein